MRRLDLLLAALLAGAPVAANAQGPAPAATSNDAVASVSSRGVRVVGIMLSSRQVLLWDESAGEYALRRVGEPVGGGIDGRIASIEKGRIVVERIAGRETYELVSAPAERLDERRAPATVTLAAADPQPASQPVAVAVEPAGQSQEADPASAPHATVQLSQPTAPTQPTEPTAPPDADEDMPASPPAAPAPPAAPPPVAVAPAAPVAPRAPQIPRYGAPIAPGYAAPMAPGYGAPMPPPPNNPSYLPAPPPAPRGDDDAEDPSSMRAQPQVGTLLVSRSELDAQIGDLQSLSAQLTVAPTGRGGFQVIALRPGSYIESLGLRAGDVVLAIDGRPLNGPEDALRACAWLHVTDHFVVEVLRGNQRLQLRYQVA